MNHKEKLSKLIEQNKGLITTYEAEADGVPRKYLSLMVRDGHLERLSQGIYLSPDAIEDRFYKLWLRCCTGIYSHETALFLLGYSDREPLRYEMTVSSGYNAQHLADEPIKLFYIRRKLHGLGKTTVETAFGRTVPCYDLERTLCDVIRNRSQMDLSIVNDAFKAYFRSREKDIDRLMDYADQLGVQKRVREYLEILL